jgi:DNA-binding transcriptional LysR family regulator
LPTGSSVLHSPRAILVALYDWNDLRIFLAVARKGSTIAAARELGTSPSTAARRMTALEEALDVTLFDRRPDGYRLTEAGRALLPAAERMELAAAELDERLAALTRSATGTVRFTTLDITASQWVIPHLPAFHAAYPQIQVEIITGDDKLDLVRGEADVALRFGPRPTEPGLVVRGLGHVELGLYCSRSYADARGVPVDVASLDRHAIIRGAGYVDERPHHQWLRDHAPSATVAHRSNSSIGILEAVRQGIGIGSLSRLTGDADPLLVRVDVGPTFTAGAWLICTEDGRRLPHVRAFLDFVGPRLADALAAR